MVQIPLSAEEFANKAKLLAEQGLALTGHQGTLEKSGVKAGYIYENGILTVTILNKPFIVSTAYCEEQIKNWLTS